ncbi:MAG: IscS subfamily cysteine desulfurase [Acidobacteria bacterium]|nr:IscS subfamily cysteine desulfurase [Acidobacteriota bacterium]
MKLPIYMDYHATTPVDPRVFAAMAPYFTEKFGNASSRNHSFGWVSEEAVERGRERVAHLINCDPSEIVFTSGATESDNLAIKGAAIGHRDKGNHIVTAATEHKAVIDTCKRLTHEGFDVTFLPVEPDGLIDPQLLADSIRPNTVLISIMGANNEIGVIQPLADIGRLARERGVLFHTDAAQAAGKIPIDVAAMKIDLLSLTAHKIYGPKGTGALYVRKSLPARLVPAMDGGGHERGLRSGTLNVPGIVGLGVACELAGGEMAKETERLTGYREKLKERLLSALDHVYLNGHPSKRLAMNLNLSFGYLEGEALLMSLRDVALSSGSACSTATAEPSHVLRALGLGEALARGSLRFGMGRFTTEEEVDYVAEKVIEQVKRLRASSPLYELATSGAGFDSDAWKHPAQV